MNNNCRPKRAVGESGVTHGPLAQGDNSNPLDRSTSVSNSLHARYPYYALSPVFTTAPQVTLGAAEYSVDEGSDATVEVVLSQTRSAATTIGLEAVSGVGTATAGDDYTAGPWSVTIPAGQTSGDITIATADDDQLETSEHFSVRITTSSLPSGWDTAVELTDSDPPQKVPVATRINIVEDDYTVSFDQAAYVVDERSGEVVVTGSLNHALADDLEVWFRYQLEGTSTGSVFSEVHGSASDPLTIPAGETRFMLRIPVLVDDGNFAGHVLRLEAMPPSLPAGEANASVDVHIGHNGSSDVAVDLSISPTAAPSSSLVPAGSGDAVAEGSVVTVTATVATAPVGRSITVPVVQLPATGAPSADEFGLGGVPAGVITIAAGQKSASVPLTVYADGAEADGSGDMVEWLLLGVGADGLSAGYVPGRGVDVLVEESSLLPVSLTVGGAATATVAEVNNAAVTLTATLGSANSSGGALQFPVRLRSAGTTAQSSDYGLPAGVSIADGQAEGTARLGIENDNLGENDETVVVWLGSSLPSGYGPGPPQAVVVTIARSDGGAGIAVGVTQPSGAVFDGLRAYDESDEKIAFDVVADPAPALPLPVCVQVTEELSVGTARLNALYTGYRTVTIPTTGKLSLPVVWTDANTDESDSTVTVTVLETADPNCGSAGEYTVSTTDPQTSALIRDDDATVVSVARTDSGPIAEDGSGAEADAEFTVTLGRRLDAGERLVAPLVLSGAGVTAGEYTVAAKSTADNHGATLAGGNTLSPTVTFVGHATDTVQVATLVMATNIDAVSENDETVTVAVAPPSAFNAEAVAARTSVGGGAGPHPINNRFNVATEAEGAGVSVTLSATGGDPNGDVVEGATDPTGYRTITVTLGRALTGDETITVPLTVDGVTVAAHYLLTMVPATQAGVTLVTTGGTYTAQNPALRFEAGATAATLRFTPVDNDRRSRPAVAIDAGEPISGGLPEGATSPTGVPLVFAIADDETGTLEVPENWALKPPAIRRAESFRLAFVTSEARDARPTDIDVYNRWAQGVVARGGHAELVPYGSLVKVFGSTAEVDARENTGMWDGSGWADGSTSAADAGVPIYWLAATPARKAADNYFDFFDGSFDNTRSTFESGSDTPRGQSVLTGSDSGGVGTPNNELGQEFVAHNFSGATGAKSFKRPMIVMSPVFTVYAPDVTVTLAGSGGDADGNPLEGAGDSTGYKTVTLTLSRALTGDETVTVPLSVTGATVGDDYTFALAPATQAGVTLVTAGGTHSAQNPAVLLEAGTQTATLRLTPVNNDYRSLPYVTVAYGTEGRAPSGKLVNVAVLGEPIVFVLADDETGPLVVPADWGLLPSGLDVGAEFRLLLATRRGLEIPVAEGIAGFDAHVRRTVVAHGHADIRAYAGLFGVLGSTGDTDGRVHAGLWDGTSLSGDDPPAVLWADGSVSAADAGIAIYALGAEKVADNYFDFCDGDWDGPPSNRSYEDGTAIPGNRAIFTGMRNNCEPAPQHLWEKNKTLAVSHVSDPFDAGNSIPCDEGLLGPTAPTACRYYGLSPVFTAPYAELSFKENFTIVDEDGGSATLTVVASAAPTSDLTVGLSYTDLSAVSGTDYTPTASFVFPAGATEATFTIALTADVVIEDNELFKVRLAAGEGYTVGSSSSSDVLITDDDDPTQKLTQSAVTVREGVGSVRVTVERDTVGGVSRVVLTPDDGTATGGPGGTGAGVDYDNTVTNLQFGAKAASVSGVFTINDDNLPEPDETFTVTLSKPEEGRQRGEVGEPAVITVTIVDDDGPAGLVIAPSALRVAEGLSATYEVSLASAPPAATTVTVSGQAGADLRVDTDPDTAGEQATVTFTTGDWYTPRTVTVTADNDSDSTDATVTLTHTVTAGGYSASPQTLTVTIADGDATAQRPEVSFVSSGGVSVVETDGVVARLGVVLSEPLRSSESLKVAYSVSGTARVGTEANKAGADAVVSPSALLVVEGYVLSSSQPGAVSRGEIVVSLIDDVWVEGAETVVVTLLPSSGYTLGEHTSRTVQITNDDTAPEVLLSVDTDEVSEGDGATRVRVRAELSNESRFESDVVVSVSVDGSGVEGAVGFAAVDDFDVTIPAGAGSASARFTLTPTANETDQPDEVVSVSASVVPAGLVVSPASIMLSDDDDAPPPPPMAVRISGGGFAAEGDASSTAKLTVRLGRVVAAGEEIEVPLAITGAGVEAGDIVVSQPADGRPGVSVSDAGTLAPVVVFTGSSQQGVNVGYAELTLAAGTDTDSIHELATIRLAATAGNGPDGGLRPERDLSGVPVSASVQVIDADATAAAVLAWPRSVLLVEGEALAGSEPVQVRLSAEPSGDVSVTAVSLDALAVRVAPGSLTFSTSDWDEPQPVTLTAADDLDTDDETVFVSLTAAGHPGFGVAVDVYDSVRKAPTTFTEAVFNPPPNDLTLRENTDGSSRPVRVGSPVTATDADGDTVTYSLAQPGPFLGFAIDAATGQITYTGKGLDQEVTPRIALVVVATSTGADGTATPVRQPVTVTVRDVDEGDPQTVTVTGVAVAGRSTLRFVSITGDPDGDPGPGVLLTFAWFASDDGDSRGTILQSDGWSKAEYPVKTTDVGRYLRLGVNYQERSGASETAYSDPIGPVGTLGLLNAAAEATSALGPGADHTSDTAVVTVSLDALVLNGETVTVPLAFTGGTLGTDFSLALAGSPTGVTLSGASVVFTGPAASKATVEVTAASAAALTNTLTVAPGVVTLSGESLVFTGTVQGPGTVTDTVASSALVGDGVVFTGGDPPDPPDPDSVSVTLARTDSGPISEDTSSSDRTATFTVTLGRALVSGETVDVPLDLSGAGVTHEDFVLSLTSGEANTGVSLREATSLQPVVRLQGAGAGVASVTITATDDSVDEDTGEVLVLALGDLDAAGLATNVAEDVVASDDGDPVTVDNRFDVLIVDGDVPSVPVVWLDGSTHLAGEASGSRSVTLRLSATPPQAAVTVAYTVTGTATAGSDFTTLSGSVVLAAGAVSAQIPVSVLDDSSREPPETIVVTLDEGSGYTLGSVLSSTVTIADDDGIAVTLTRTDSGNIAEDPAPAGDGRTQATVDAERSATFTVTLDRALKAGEILDVPLELLATSLRGSGGFTVTDFSLALTDGAANTGVVIQQEATLKPVLRFNRPGARTAAFTVWSVDDLIDENDEIFTVELAPLDAPGLATNVSGGAVPGEGSNVFEATIIDDDTAGMEVSQSDGLTFTAEPSGTDTLSVQLRSQPRAAVTVTVSSSDATAMVVSSDGTAFATSAQLTFTPQNAFVPQTVTVKAVDDSSVNPSGWRRVTLTFAASSSDRGYRLTERVTANVQDDEEPVLPLVQFAATSYDASEDEPVRRETAKTYVGRTATMELSLTPAPPNGATVGYTVTGTATSGSDFTATSGEVVMAPGATTASIPLTVLDDDTDEPPETVIVTLNPHDAYEIGANAAATVTIADDDATTVNLGSESTNSISEGGHMTFDLSLGRALTEGETVAVRVQITGSADLTPSDLELEVNSPHDVSAGPISGTAGSLYSVVTFSGPSSNSQTVIVRAVDDDVSEADESAVVWLRLGSAVANGTNVGGGVVPLAGRDNRFNLTVLNNDPGVVITESAGSTRVSENPDASDATDSYTVHLATEPAGNVTVAVTPDAAVVVAGGDGQFATSATLTFTPQNWSEPLTVAVAAAAGGDTTADDANRSAAIAHTVSGYGSVTAAPIDVEIVDDDPTLVEIHPAGPFLTENNSAVTAAVTVSLSRPLAAGEVIDVPLLLNSSSGAILSGRGSAFRRARAMTWRASGTGVSLITDPLSSSLQRPNRDRLVLRMSGGAQEATIHFASPNPDRDNTNETVKVTLEANVASLDRPERATNVGGGVRPAPYYSSTELIIVDNGAPARLLAAPRSLNVVEGDTASYWVRPTTNPGGALTVNVSSADTNRVTAPASVTVGAAGWQSGAKVTVTGLADADSTDNTVNINHTASGYGARDSVTVNLRESSTAPTVSFAAATYTATEAAGGRRNIDVVVNASPAPPSNLQVAYTVAGTATGRFSGGDYRRIYSPVTVGGGGTGTIRITVRDDALDDDGETIILRLSDSSNYQVGAIRTATVTIIDKAAPLAALTVDTPTVTEDGGAVTVTVTAALNGPADASDTTVNVTVAPSGTAGAVDFTATPSTFAITVPAGQTSATETFTLTPTDDNDDETHEQITVSGTIAGAAAVPVTPAAIRLNDDDGGGLSVTLNSTSSDIAEIPGEGNMGHYKPVSVYLGRVLIGDETVTVPLTVAGATVSDDYTLALVPASQPGVTLLTDSPHSAQNPAVLIEAGAAAASLRFTAVDNDRRSQPYVSIGFGTGARAPSHANVVEGLAAPSGGPFRFAIGDDEVGPVIVPQDWPLLPANLEVGEEFRLLFRTSSTRDATSTDIG
ncbi:Calx-beta domain-containing protein, partial [Candidatus Poriferisocius sp.]|uniref:Calx-beta domain-containing protein n=1 Tax=Candidatus Poriferisocius sp. TaxID=3101276 RepID=UPI003B51B72D